MILDGLGGVVVTWSDQRAGGVLQDDIYAQRLTSAGMALWGVNGTVVCDTLGRQSNAVIVRDDSGGFVVAWSDERAGLGVPDIRVQRLDLAGNRMWTTGGAAACAAAGTRTDPALVQGAGGRTLVGWRDLRAGSPGAYVACLDSTGVLCWGSDGVAVGIGPAAAEVREVALWPDDNGGAIAIWRDRRTAVSYDVYSARVTAAGQVGTETAVETHVAVDHWALGAPQPTPAAGTVRLRFTMDTPAVAEVALFDLAGRRIRRIAAGTWSSGGHELVWDGRDDAGRRVAAGVYVVRLAVGARVATQRVVWLR
jgi:hypothetical protein